MPALYIHLGFMPEEMSAKLKPDLSDMRDNKGILIITRDNVAVAHELFEQPVKCYQGLLNAIEKKHYARTHSNKENENGTDDLCIELKNILEKYLNFNVEKYRIEGAKQKLSNGPAQLNIIRIGNCMITDIYLQFPEMGFQSTLAYQLVKEIFNGLFEWLEPAFKQEKYKYLHLDAFGAGGSLHEKHKPGSKSEIKSAINIRRFINKKTITEISNKIECNFKSKNSLRTHKAERNYNFFSYPDHKNSLFTQEIARFYYINLANYKTKHSQNPDNLIIADENKELELYLSAPYINYLNKDDINYKNACDSILQLNRDILALQSRIIALTNDSSPLVNLIEQKEVLENELSQAKADNNQEEIDFFSVQINKYSMLISEENIQLKLLVELKIQIENKNKELKSKESIKSDIEKEIISSITTQLSDIEDKEPISTSLQNLEKKHQKYQENSISCSASFFLDETIKHASKILLGDKAADANMEDDIIIKIVKYVKLRIKTKGLQDKIRIGKSCVRVNCDPFKIDETLKSVFEEWAKTNCYTLDAYVNAILWQASGFQDEFLTDDARWSILNSLDNFSDSNLFFGPRIEEREFIIDPCWREIATDFLAEIIKGDAFTNAKDQTIITSARELKKELNEYTGNDLKSDFCGKIGNLVEKFLDKNGFKTGENKYKIWIRKYSWGGNQEQSLDLLWLNSANIDRALYVSTNISALKIRGVERIEYLRSDREANDNMISKEEIAKSNSSESSSHSAPYLTPPPQKRNKLSPV